MLLSLSIMVKPRFRLTIRNVATRREDGSDPIT